MTRGHVPSILAVPIEERVGTDPELAFLEAAPGSLAGSLVTHSFACSRVFWRDSVLVAPAVRIVDD